MNILQNTSIFSDIERKKLKIDEDGAEDIKAPVSL
jgi:hypothetical protein